MMALVLIGMLLVPSLAWAEGWVLVSPPFEIRGNEVIHLGVPLSQWEYVGAFDSARECEDVRLALGKEAKKDKSFTAQASKIGQCMPYALWWQSKQPSPCSK